MTMYSYRACGSPVQQISASGLQRETCQLAQGSLATIALRSSRRATSLGRAAVIACIALCVLGCSKKIDGSSVESFAESVKQIEANLPVEARKQFDGDLMAVGNLKRLTIGQLRTEMNGKSSAEVHAIAEELRAAAARLQEQQDRERLADLAKKKARADVEATEVASVTAQVVAIVLEPKQWGETQEITFQLEVKNGSSQAIGTLRYVANLQWSGVEIPKIMHLDVQPPLGPRESRQFSIKKVNFGGASGSSDLRNATVSLKVTGSAPPGGAFATLENPSYFGPLERVELDRLSKLYGQPAMGAAPNGPMSSTGTAHCVEKWVAAHRKEVGAEALIGADQLSEWEEGCKAGKLPS
jgi:hypothetical protein